MKKFRVYFVEDAEKNLFDIYSFVAKNDSVNKANDLLEKIEQLTKSLSEFPDRGHIPPELERIGIFEYKEIHYKSYRVIYQIIKNKIYVHCILDRCRDLSELLEYRLLR